MRDISSQLVFGGVSGGMEPPGRDPAERRKKRGGPGCEEPHNAGVIRRHRGQQRKVGRKVLRECPEVQQSAVSRGEWSTALDALESQAVKTPQCLLHFGTRTEVVVWVERT